MKSLWTYLLLDCWCACRGLTRPTSTNKRLVSRWNWRTLPPSCKLYYPYIQFPVTFAYLFGESRLFSAHRDFFYYCAFKYYYLLTYWSVSCWQLSMPRTTTSLGDRAFAVAGPRVWNSLPFLLPSVSGTAFLLPSVIRHCRRQYSESCWKLICLFKGRGAGDLWTGALEMYWLTN